GDSGIFGNAFLVGRPFTTANGSVAPQIENDAVLGELDEHFDGDFIGEPTLLEMARRAGYSTAALGKHGPTLLQDHRARDGALTIVIDDATGGANGIPLSPDVTA